jgi:hypothetical protein
MARIPQVKFKINLDQLFGERLNVNRSTREAIGQAVIDRIVERTQSGIDKFGRSLGRYSPSYKSSLAFKVTKGGDSIVNLTQTGDMLGSLTIVEQSDRTLTIGFDDSDQNVKAYGHISGMEGHPVLEGKVKKRDFMGLPKGELDKIASEFESQAKQVDSIENATTREELDQAITDLIDELSGEIEGG